MAQRKREDCRDAEQERDLDAIEQILDLTIDREIAAMRLPIPLEQRQQRVVRLARQCIRQVRRISPSTVLES